MKIVSLDNAKSVEEAAKGADSVDIHDRVTEAYFGKMGPQFMRETQQRIHWICGQVRGNRVLDVGCSQGITAILLGREGKKVTAVDAAPRSIEQATMHLEEESERVRENVSFINGDFLSHEFGGVPFDTVIIAEVLEHLVLPEAFVEAAASRLAPDGSLIVTVPFGVNDFFDHKRTYYLLEPYRLLSSRFDVVEVALLGKWLGLVGRRRSDNEKMPSVEALSSELVERLETAFFVLERRLRDEAAATLTRLNDANLKYRTATEQVAALKQQVTNEDIAHKEVKREVLQLKQQLEAEEKGKQAEVGRFQSSLDAQRGALHEAEKRLVKLEAERESVSRRLDEANVKHQTASEQLTLLTQKVASADFAYKQAEREGTKLKQQLAATSQQLQIAEQKRSGHYAHLEAERKKSKLLAKQVELLEKDNKRMSNSLSLAVGAAIVKTKSLKDAFLLPGRLYGAVRKHKEKLRMKQLQAAQASNKTSHHLTESPSGQPSNDVKKTDGSKSPEAFEDTSLTILGWPLPEQNSKIRMMSIFDEFSRECFAPVANLIEPRPDNWLPLLERDKPEFLFVESTWRGNKSTWQYRVAKYANPPGQELTAMVAEFKARKLPTVFWNKEDPVHFDNFIHAAQEFDFIFTTAEEAIPRYAQRSKAKIAVLPFAAEAGLHNPIGSGQRNEKVCFAGSFYANRFVERRDDQLMLLDAASHFDLDIYDRNAGANVAKDFCFPERFDRFIRGNLPYRDMNKAYRNYRVFLNVNSVIDSKTMFSRRVFELLACGTPVVSTISAGIEDMFGSDLVWMVKNETEAKEAIHTLLSSPGEWRRRSLQGIRAVFARHTFAHRFEDVLRLTGIRDHFVAEKRVLLVAEVRSRDELDSVIDAHSRQKLVNAKASLFIVARAPGLAAGAANVELVHSTAPLSTLIPKEAQRLQITHVAFIAPAALYGAYYLQDILHAFDYTGASLVGKPCSGVDEYAYADALVQAGSVLSAKVLERGDFSTRILDAGNLASEVRRIGEKVFISDAANFNESQGVLADQQRRTALKELEI